MSLLTFPCSYTFKVIGKNTYDFETSVVGIIRKHFPNMGEGSVVEKASKKDKYLSITIKIEASSQAQLDNAYTELSQAPHVIMAL